MHIMLRMLVANLRASAPSPYSPLPSQLGVAVWAWGKKPEGL